MHKQMKELKHLKRKHNFQELFEGFTNHVTHNIFKLPLVQLFLSLALVFSTVKHLSMSSPLLLCVSQGSVYVNLGVYDVTNPGRSLL